jgi:hypothetical protein
MHLVELAQVASSSTRVLFIVETASTDKFTISMIFAVAS